MPVEMRRVTRLKLVANPDGDPDAPPTLKVPVIDQIFLVDAKSGAQGIAPLFDNSDANTTRQVRVVTGTTGNNALGVGGSLEVIGDVNGVWSDGSSRLQVERIDRFLVRDAKSGGQQSTFILKDPYDPAGDEQVPTGLITHRRYYADPPEAALPDVTALPNGASAWLLVEQTDQLPAVDAKTNSQGYRYILNHPLDNSDIDNAVDTYPVSSQPLRLDPFQNVVDVSWKSNGDFAAVGYRNDGPIFHTSPESGPDKFAGDNPRILFVVQSLKGVFLVGDRQLCQGFYDAGASIGGDSSAAISFQGTTTANYDDADDPAVPAPQTIIIGLPQGALNRPIPVSHGIPVYSDAAGTVFVTSSSISKYDPNGNQLWSNPASPSTVIVQGANIVDLEASNESPIYNQSGAQVGTITIPTSDANGFGFRSFDTDATGNFYAQSDDSLEKFDNTGKRIWSVQGPFSDDLNNGFNPISRFGSIAAIGNFIVVGGSQVQPPPDGEPINFQTIFYLLVYDNKGNIVIQQQLGIYSRIVGVDIGTATFTFGRSDFIVRRPRYPAAT